MRIVHPKLTRVTPERWRLRSPILAKPRSKSQFQFSRIVDTQTPIPGCPGFFNRLGFGAISTGVTPKNTAANRRMVFWGGNEYGYSGIYQVDSSGIKVVVDSQKCLPDQPHRFALFGSAPGFDDDKIIFLAQDDTAQIQLYQDIHYRLTSLVSTGQQVLGDRFINLSNPVACGRSIAFLARLESTEQKGLFLYHDRAIVAVAYQRLAGPFLEDLSEPDVDQAGNVVFCGQDREHRPGLYRYANQQVNCIVTTQTPIPGGIGTFTRFSTPTVIGPLTTFLGRGRLMQQGLYQMGPNGLQAVVDVHTRMPASLEPFSRFQTFAMAGDRIAFLAGSEGGCFGLFLAEGRQISKVIEVGDRLDDATVVSLHLGRKGLSDTALVFKARFQDGTQALFQAEG
ncbi:MAG: hypothetical protein AAFU71_17415 [Cyanobacteria bacterium J06632_22]